MTVAAGGGGDPVAGTRCGSSGVGVGIFWCRGVGAAAEELIPVLRLDRVLARGLEGVELLAVVVEFGAEVA